MWVQFYYRTLTASHPPIGLAHYQGTIQPCPFYPILYHGHLDHAKVEHKDTIRTYCTCEEQLMTYVRQIAKSRVRIHKYVRAEIRTMSQTCRKAHSYVRTYVRVLREIPPNKYVHKQIHRQHVHADCCDDVGTCNLIIQLDCFQFFFGPLPPLLSLATPHPSRKLPPGNRVTP